jgi:hypothetical protein
MASANNMVEAGSTEGTGKHEYQRERERLQ